jgi:myo-inositol-1(or 4)-monophosphatase
MDCPEIIFKTLEVAKETLEDTEACSREPVLVKGGRDYSTNLDLEMELRMRDFLSKTTPQIPIIGEEISPSVSDFDLAWVMDPIDGTINFSRGHPFFGVSLALVSPDEVLAGGVILPEIGRTYFAERGGGAMLNGERLRVSEQTALEKSVVSVGDFSVDRDGHTQNRWQCQILSNLAERVLRVRMYGAAVLDMCFVADGSIEGAITLSNRIWDIKPGALLVREAGGVVVDHDGQWHDIGSTTTIATSAGLKKQLLELVGGSGVRGRGDVEGGGIDGWRPER